MNRYFVVTNVCLYFQINTENQICFNQSCKLLIAFILSQPQGIGTLFSSLSLLITVDLRFPHKIYPYLKFLNEFIGDYQWLPEKSKFDRAKKLCFNEYWYA